MNIIDIIFIIPVIWFAYRGFVNGLIIELATIIALFLGIYLSIHFSVFIGNKIGLSGKYENILAFIITLISVFIVIKLLAKFIDKLFSLTALGLFNKIGGIIFGIAKITLLISVLLHFINKFDSKKMIISDKNRAESKLIEPIEKIAPALYSEFKKDNDKLN
ncbi:MAG: CvpA family protein [Bacteroidetes bacterium]|nr:CvpA family protein [Bacteroidota bacterium]